MMTVTQYSYDSIQKGKIYLFLIVFGVVIIMLLYVVLRGVFVLFIGSDTQGSSDDVFAKLFLVSGPLFFPLILGLMVAFLSNFDPDIRVSDEGIQVQVFVFWWVFIPWENIEAIQPTFTSQFLQNSSQIVLVKKLTPIHLLFGWIYAFKIKPGFLIRRRIEQFDELVRIVKDRIENH